MDYLVRGQEVLFNLAGQVSHIDSMTDPFTDLEINCRSQLWILEAVRKHNPEAQDRLRGHAPGLRQAAAPARGRDAPAEPHRRQRHQQDLGRVVPPRLPLGVRHPRLARCASPTPTGRASSSGTTARASSAGSCARRCCGEEIQLFGDGAQKRDFDYVDDVVDAFLRAGAMDAADGQVFNLGGERAGLACSSSRSCMIEIAGAGLVPPGALPARSASASTSATSTPTPPRSATTLGWEPQVPLRDGPRADPRLLPAAQGALPVSAARRPLRATSRPTWPRCAREIDAALARVLDSGWFILGPEGEAFERELAAALRRAARGRRWPTAPRPSSSRWRRWASGRATRSSPRRSPPPSPPSPSLRAGARPVFADLDPAHAQRLARRRSARALTPRTQGAPARPPLRPSRRPRPAAGAGAARAGSRWSRTPARPSARATRAGRWARSPASARSRFYPTKNLGALGDGGAVLVERSRAWRRACAGCATAARATATATRSPGINSRLDEMQAARPAREASRHLAAWTERRRALAALYLRGAARARASACPRSSPTRARSTTCSWSATRGATRSLARAQGARRRHAHPLPDPAAPAAGLRAPRRAAGRLPGGRARRRARSSPCPSTPR